MWEMDAAVRRSATGILDTYVAAKEDCRCAAPGATTYTPFPAGGRHGAHGRPSLQADRLPVTSCRSTLAAPDPRLEGYTVDLCTNVSAGEARQRPRKPSNTYLKGTSGRYRYGRAPQSTDQEIDTAMADVLTTHGYGAPFAATNLPRSWHRTRRTPVPAAAAPSSSRRGEDRPRQNQHGGARHRQLRHLTEQTFGREPRAKTPMQVARRPSRAGVGETQSGGASSRPRETLLRARLFQQALAAPGCGRMCVRPDGGFAVTSSGGTALSPLDEPAPSQPRQLVIEPTGATNLASSSAGPVASLPA